MWQKIHTLALKIAGFPGFVNFTDEMRLCYTMEYAIPTGMFLSFLQINVFDRWNGSKPRLEKKLPSTSFSNLNDT